MLQKPATTAVVKTLPLTCPQCGAFHPGDVLERTGGACPATTASRRIPGKVCIVQDIPPCDFATRRLDHIPCSPNCTDVSYDFQTTLGVAASGCEAHWQKWALYPGQLGVGKAQKWVRPRRTRILKMSWTGRTLAARATLGRWPLLRRA